MHPIPVFIIKKVLPNFMMGGCVDIGMWNELEYSCNPLIFQSLKEISEQLEQIDYSGLPDLKGTERQISYAFTIRQRALRAEVTLQNVLLNSKILKFKLSPSVKDIDISHFWISNKDELTRQLKVRHLVSGKEFDCYDVPNDTQRPNGHIPIWQAERLNYLWETTEAELAPLRNTEEAIRYQAEQANKGKVISLR